MINDSTNRYGTISRVFHWGMALLIGWQLLKFFDRIADGEHWVGQTLVPWHISIGTLLLVLVAARLLWVASQRRHRPQSTGSPAAAFLAKAGHFLLYAGMVLMPLTGISLMIGNGYGLSAFGLQLAPADLDIPWLAAIGTLHSPIAWLLLIMIVGHIGMALLHRFVKRDDVMTRMW